MRRRTVIKRSVLGGGIAVFAGCSDGDDAPPPRRSNVIESLETSGNTLEISLEEEDGVWIDSRADLESESDASQLRALASPIDTVAAAKGSARGATGRAAGGFSSAPKTDKGRAWYGGGTYVGGWYDDNDDDVTRYDGEAIEVTEIGVGYHGTSAQFRDDPPGPGSITWDAEFTERRKTYEHSISRAGWYRVGARLEHESSHDFGWEAVDFELVSDGTNGYRIENEWKVSPRI